jgi:hypothetical protein
VWTWSSQRLTTDHIFKEEMKYNKAGRTQNFSLWAGGADTEVIYNICLI